MPSTTIPLFPLHVVVFPRVALPLHIFEERYKEMVGAAIRDNSEFGIVLAQANGIASAGCTVAVDKVLQMYPDGRMDIVTSGRRRFEIAALNQEHAWLEAEVLYFDDDDLAAPAEALRLEAVEHYKALRAFSSAAGRGEPDLADRQLSLRSESARLKEFNRYLAEYIPRKRAIERMRELAPTNGSAKKPTGL
jgi:Lon protease-like protein